MTLDVRNLTKDFRLRNGLRLIAFGGAALRLAPWKPSQPMMKSASMRWVRPSFS